MAAQYNSSTARSASVSELNADAFADRRKSIFDKPSRELMDELRDGPVQGSTVGRSQEFALSFRDQALARGGSTQSLHADGKDNYSHMKASW
ncbi:hypothetical protein HDU87_006571 [Geranomyces variabilis]|uniref:Uncharacterized protein n=1 Tax=Geranomyces variabilis TaxID=109894 RepID=A0AAD5TF33_9FUNG|nr:hypothetical protein HDU87_006571 [Geranomyces variabilis]